MFNTNFMKLNVTTVAGLFASVATMLSLSACGGGQQQQMQAPAPEIAVMTVNYGKCLSSYHKRPHRY